MRLDYQAKSLDKCQCYCQLVFVKAASSKVCLLCVDPFLLKCKSSINYYLLNSFFLITKLIHIFNICSVLYLRGKYSYSVNIKQTVFLPNFNFNT